MTNRAWLGIGVTVLLGLGGYVGYRLTDSRKIYDPLKFDRTKQIVIRPMEMARAKRAMKHVEAVRTEGGYRDEEAEYEGAIAGERVILFPDAASMAEFLSKAGSKVRVLGKMERLNALRIGFEGDEWKKWLEDGMEATMIFPIWEKPPKEGGVQPGALAVGDRLMETVGISGDHHEWGKGITIAILDSGVTHHSGFSGSLHEVNMVDLPSDLSQQNGHGTAVASMIVGNGEQFEGVAPGSNLYSIRVANDDGESNTFLLAQGIIAAVDAGVDLINISMGTTGDSPILQKAIEYAEAHRVMIIAAAGNEGDERVSYPAAYPGVVAVGAVDGAGNHMDFSNTGQEVDLSAPGYGLYAGWTSDQIAEVSGTSFSSPIVAGSIAALMSEYGLTSYQAYQRLLQYANDGGAPGVDRELGQGMPDLGRAMTGDTPGVIDAAVASSRYLPPDRSNPNGKIEVLIQNRGTETLVNSQVVISYGGQQVTKTLTTLPQNGVMAIQVPMTQVSTGSIQIDSQVRLPSGVVDRNPNNNRRTERYVQTSPP